MEKKILHIYSDAMDLYGDYFNLRCICQVLEERFKVMCRVDDVDISGEIHPNGYDMVYIGHGKARNLEAVSGHFIRYGDVIRAMVEQGTLFFVTGSAQLLFGERIYRMDGTELPGIGMFPYEGYDKGQVFTSDVIGRIMTEQGESDFFTYGFINRTHEMRHTGDRHPFFRVLQGDGDAPGDRYEGTHYRNYFGTWQMGPLLARNPQLLELLVSTLLGEVYTPPLAGENIAQTALELTLKEFQLD